MASQKPDRETLYVATENFQLFRDVSDFWLVNDGLQDDIVSADIIPSIKSDYSAITLSINGVDDSERGPSFWKFICSLVNDNNYRDLLDTNTKSWLEEFKEVVDKRVLWDLLKYSTCNQNTDKTTWECHSITLQWIDNN